MAKPAPSGSDTERSGSSRSDQPAADQPTPTAVGGTSTVDQGAGPGPEGEWLSQDDADYDPLDQADADSFPASDPPSYASRTVATKKRDHSDDQPADNTAGGGAPTKA